MKRVIFTSSFILGHAAVLIIYSALSIYYFDNNESIYTQDISFRISLLVVFIGAVFTGIGFGIGTALSGWISKYWLGVLLGGIFAPVVLGLMEIIAEFTTGRGLSLLFVLWLGGSISIPLVASKIRSAGNG